MPVGDALIALGGAFLAAGILGRAGRRLGLPTIPLFMLAGFVFGPHTPGVALVRDPVELELIATLGLVFLLFYLGIEFDIGDLLGGGRRLAAAGASYLLLNVGGGLAFGVLLGWGWPEALVLAGVLGISSSAIVTKILVELGRLARPESRLILGIIVLEDIFLALYLAALQPVLGAAESLAGAAVDILVAFAFLLGLAVVARWGGRLLGKLVAIRDDELLVVTFAGVALLTAGVAAELGVSEAIGAFMIGLALAATPAAPRIRGLVHPLRDAFGAMFFFLFGLSIDPGEVASVALPVAAAVLLTIVLNLVAGAVAARLHGFGRDAAGNIGLTVLARGEFALVLATLAVGAGLDRRLTPFVAGYVLILAIISPLAALHSARLQRFVRRRSPAGRGGTATAEPTGSRYPLVVQRAPAAGRRFTGTEATSGTAAARRGTSARRPAAGTRRRAD
ncbi:cation:proton antiporter [Actinopolymorpha pittospori]